LTTGNRKTVREAGKILFGGSQGNLRLTRPASSEKGARSY